MVTMSKFKPDEIKFKQINLKVTSQNQIPSSIENLEISMEWVLFHSIIFSPFNEY